MAPTNSNQNNSNQNNSNRNEISVDGSVYIWSVNATDTVVDIAIEKYKSDGQRLRVGYFYQEAKPENFKISDAVITDELIKKLIYFARKQGWSPSDPGLVEFFVYGEEAGPVDWTVL